VVTWSADSAACKEQGTTGKCTSKNQGEYVTLDDAKAHCEFVYGVGKGGAESCGPCQWVTSANKTCTDMYEACIDKGWPCIRQVEGGMTLCAHCRRDCKANRPYKFSDCYTCGFY